MIIHFAFAGTAGRNTRHEAEAIAPACVGLTWLGQNVLSIEWFLDFLNYYNGSPDVIAYIKGIIHENLNSEGEPTNPPVSVENPLCSEILNFQTFTNTFDNLQFTGITLFNSYFTWTVPNGSPITVHIDNLRFTVEANHNATCLSSSSTFAANAINNAMATTQQSINSSPQNASMITDIEFLTLLYYNFDQEVKNCNSSYKGSVQTLSGVNLGYPTLNLDSNIADCP